MTNKVVEGAKRVVRKRAAVVCIQVGVHSPKR
jgi:hypothetical protein